MCIQILYVIGLAGRLCIEELLLESAGDVKKLGVATYEDELALPDCIVGTINCGVYTVAKF